MSYPPIPTLIRGAGGAITVRRVKRPRGSNGEDCWATWDDARRAIRLDRDAPLEHQWRVLFHELTHSALHDAGIENLLDDAGVEAICDAMASSRMAEFRGQLGIMDA